MHDPVATAFPLHLRAGLARTIALVALALDALALVLAVVYPTSMADYPPGVMASVLAGPMTVQTAVAFAPRLRLPEWAREWLLRLMAVTAVVSVFGAVLAQPVDNGTGFAFTGFALALSAVTLRPRDHLVVLAGTSVVGLTILFTVTPEPLVGLFILLPGLGIGLMAGMWARAHGRMIAELGDSREEALETSAALRAVVDGAHDAAVADPEAVLQAVVDATRHLDAHSSGVYVMDDAGLLSFGATYNVPERLRGEAILPGHGLLGEVLRCGETVVIDDYAAFVGSVPDFVELGLNAAIGTPVRLPDGRMLGVLVVGRGAGRGPFAPAAVDALELLADHAARALQLSLEVDADRRTLRTLGALLERQRDFVATVSHELRTPVTVIAGLATTMTRLGDAMPPEQHDHLLERLSANAASLTQIVESLLDTARLERGLTAHHEVMDLGELAVGCVERLSSLMETHTVTVHVEDDVLVRADDGLLTRVVENLLINAQRHTPDGTHVEVRVLRREQHVEMVVRDDGPGIPADVLPHIKERFVRAGDHTTRATRGLGIGLALADQVLMLHGSTLRVASRQEQGATFGFTLLHATTEPSSDDVVRRHTRDRAELDDALPRV